jgi:Tfp pilus assembly protein PilO
MTRTAKWSALTAGLVVVLLIAGWMLLVSPKRGEAAETRDQVETMDQATVLLTSKIARLKVQAADLPKEQAKLTQIRSQIPDNPELPRLIRDLSKAAKSAGAVLDSVAPSTPAPLDASGATAAGTPGSTGTSPAPGTAAPGTATAGTAATTGSAGQLVMIPVTVEASGKYFEIEQFVNKLEGMQRAFLVTGFQLDNPGAAAGKTTLKLSIKGRIFVAAGAAAPVTTTPSSTTAQK